MHYNLEDWTIFIIAISAMCILGLIIYFLEEAYKRFCDRWDRHVRRLKEMEKKEKARKKNIGL